jgi:Bacteriophage head-tail adaptor
MNPGDLRDRIKVIAVVEMRDEIGGAAETLVTKGTIWARVRIPAVKDGILAMQDVELRTHEVTCRAGPAAPVAGDLIDWNGTRLRVRGTRPDLKNGFVVADCVGDKP